VRGTTITVEDLFFNVVIRRKAMKSANEEYHRCLDIMLRYSIHFAGISFTCKKAGAGTPDLHTQSGASKLDNIRLSFGSAVGNEVLPLEGRLDTLNCSFSGLCSNANFNMKKFVFILFINNRLVESTSLRSAIDSVYSKYLPKLTHPFVYLALDIAAHSIDVNVHPTKREVRFLS
jgi:DNA mismatch repair protein MLH1